MTEAAAALSLDRLPWLPDEPPARGHAGLVLSWALASIALVAVGGYWLGISAVADSGLSPGWSDPQSLTVPLPQARPAPPKPAPRHAEPVEPFAAMPAPVVQEGPAARRPSVELREKPSRPIVEHSVRQHAAVPPAANRSDLPQLWPVRVVQGASGRLIRVGQFRTVHDAKRGWWAIVRANPTLEHLPALVVPVHARSNGRLYYRLQMGTTSQAHSAVLCQRMRMIAESCAVIGLSKPSREKAF